MGVSLTKAPQDSNNNNRTAQSTQVETQKKEMTSVDEAAVDTDAAFMDRYSRQIGTYGMDTMTKLISLKVLVVGCGGVGAEAAKNLALAGVHTITLLDNRTPTPADLGVNFSLDETCVGSKLSVAEYTRRLVAELNPTVRAKVATELTEELVGAHSVVVFTATAPDLRLSTLSRWNAFCRTAPAGPISFILAFQGGALASVFVDHGNSFKVKDITGRPALQKQIEEVVTRVDKKHVEYTRIRFATPEGQTPGALGDFTSVKITDVKGLVNAAGESVNDKIFHGFSATSDPKNCIRIYPSLKSQGYSDYVTGGFLHEQKATIEVKFRSFEEAIVAPGAFVDVSPFMDGGLESLVHVALAGLLQYAEAHNGSLPPLHSSTEAQEVVAAAKAYIAQNANLLAQIPPAAPQEELPDDPNDERPKHFPEPPAPKPLVLDGVDEDFIFKSALLAQAQLQPLGAFIGAIVAQEIVKITGKYKPITQFFNYHCAEVLPDGADFSSPDFAPTGTRYDHNVAIFGKAFQSKLSNLRLFMVGCGALGCENIKNFALSGIACGDAGSLVVTDNDRIEISNLSRQFLFREDNVGQPKSVAAGNRMKQMNPSAKIDARQDFVAEKTQHLYPDSFWMSLDGVVNALDNIEARLYVDRQCVLFKKVLVEAGTMGTGGNVDIIVPGKTTSYSDGGAAEEAGGIPMCTLRNFPYIFDHCIEWARAQFDDLFVSPIQQTQTLVEDPAQYVAKIRGDVAKAESAGVRRGMIEKYVKSLKGLTQTLDVLKSSPSLDDCVQMAWNVMHQLFRDRILDLQHAFPRDSKKSNNEPFWSGHRTYPTPVDGSPESIAKYDDILEFLIASANLYACMFGIHKAKHEPRFNDPKHRWKEEYRTKEWIIQHISKLRLPEFIRSAVDGLDEESSGALKNEDHEAAAEMQLKEFDRLLSSAEQQAAACKQSQAQPLEFEKDDDDNFHIDFITAAANLRAVNYSITTQDRMKVKLVAGKIIPAIATTTAAVTGLALIEFYKVLQNKDVSSLRNGMLDVGTNYYVLFERDAPIRNKSTVVKTYLPEKDYTYRKKVIRVPEGFTKYDSFVVDVTPKTTMFEFAEQLLAQVNATRPPDAANEYEILAVGVGQGTLWNGLKKHSNTNRSLMELVEEQKRKEGSFVGDRSFWETRELFPDIVVSLTIEDEDDVDEVEVETATIVLRVQKQ